MIRLIGPSSIKIMFQLLVEVMAIHVQVPIIEIGKPSFERLLTRTRPIILFQQFDNSCMSFQKLLTYLFDATWG